MSVSTIDRRVVPLLRTIETPWGQRLIPVSELERFADEHLEAPRGSRSARAAGRPEVLPSALVERIRSESKQGSTLGAIARSLTLDGVPTAHGGRRWWPSTVRAVLQRASRVHGETHGESAISPGAREAK